MKQMFKLAVNEGSNIFETYSRCVSVTTDNVVIR
jgi:hypothetical protein